MPGPRKFENEPRPGGSGSAIPRKFNPTPRKVSDGDNAAAPEDADGNAATGQPSAVKRLNGAENRGSTQRRLRGPEPSRPAAFVDRIPEGVRTFNDIPRRED